MTPTQVRDEQGAVAVEFAILVPVLVLLFGLVVGGARVWLARATVDHMAVAAARAASLARTAEAAEREAGQLARAQATTDGLRCGVLTVEVDVRSFAVPVGQPARTSVDVTCTVPLADLIVPGWPGELQVTASAESVLDRYRARS